MQFDRCINGYRQKTVGAAIFIRLNAATFIKFLAFPVRRLFKGDVYFEITFFPITDDSYYKSVVNIM